MTDDIELISGTLGGATTEPKRRGRPPKSKVIPQVQRVQEDTSDKEDVQAAKYTFADPKGFTAVPPGIGYIPMPYSLVMKGQFCQWEYKPNHYFVEIKPLIAGPVPGDMLVWVRSKDIVPEQLELTKTDWGSAAVAALGPRIMKKAG